MTDHPLLTWLGNLTSLVAIVASLGGWIPVFAAVIAIVWYIVQLYESATFQKWRARRYYQRMLSAKARLIAMQTTMMGSHGNGDRVFWEKVIIEGQKSLADLRRHEMEPGADQ